jgi:hypothetical protein
MRSEIRKEDPMRDLSVIPNITVTIGRHTRQYFAFVTNAPADLDSPGTVTLHSTTMADAVGFAADPITLDAQRGAAPGRLVLIDALELAWQRAKYRGNQHLLLRADPGLIGLNALQHWLWLRLKTAVAAPVAA